jgi:hypothetical protein
MMAFLPYNHPVMGAQSVTHGALSMTRMDRYATQPQNFCIIFLILTKEK